MHRRPATPHRVHRSKRDPRGRTTAAEQSSSSQAGGTTNPEACASLRASRMPRSLLAPDKSLPAQKRNRAAQRDILGGSSTPSGGRPPYPFHPLGAVANSSLSHRTSQENATGNRQRPGRHAKSNKVQNHRTEQADAANGGFKAECREPPRTARRAIIVRRTLNQSALPSSRPKPRDEPTRSKHATAT